MFCPLEIQAARNRSLRCTRVVFSCHDRLFLGLHRGKWPHSCTRSTSKPCRTSVGSTTASAETGKTPAANLPPAYYMVRFGLLLTANTAAYLLRPGVPRADAYELSLVKQLATLPGQAFTDAAGGY